MADDLIIKYFREELTEGEEQALLERLGSSHEEALRFGQHAETSYRHYGLPEPQWRGGGPPLGFFPKSRFSPGIWLSIVLLTGFLGWLGWHALSLRRGHSGEGEPEQQTVTSQAQTSQGLPDSDEVIPKKTKKTRESIALPKKPSNPNPEKIAEEKTGAVSRSTSVTENPIPLIAVSTPVNITTQPHHPHSNLEVMIRRSSPGQVTVEVLNPSGIPVVLLYQGLLEPGNWAFDWDGKFGNGELASPGIYRIQVQSGSISQSRSVVIRQK